MFETYKKDLNLITEDDVNKIMLHVKERVINKLVSAKICRFKVYRDKVTEFAK